MDSVKLLFTVEIEVFNYSFFKLLLTDLVNRCCLGDFLSRLHPDNKTKAQACLNAIQSSQDVPSGVP